MMRTGRRVSVPVWAALLGVALIAGVAAPAGAAGSDLTKAQRERVDLSLATIDKAGLRGIVAPTPVPTTTPPAPGETNDALCGIDTLTVVFAERYERGELNGEHALSDNSNFNFVFTDTHAALFSKVSDAKQYMKEVTKASADCVNYYYGDDTSERYIPQRAFRAPKAGDQTALLVATLVFPSGNQRDDVFSFVRVGPLTSQVHLQLSEPITEPQLQRVARAQAQGLEAALASAKKARGEQD
jgi:hypothetical protein